MNRREFLDQATASTAPLSLMPSLYADTTDRPHPPKPRSDQVGASAPLPARIGSYYDAEVPDTLDLAERARLGLNHFTSIIIEDLDYPEMYYQGDFAPGGGHASPGYMFAELPPIFACQ